MSTTIMIDDYKIKAEEFHKARIQKQGKEKWKVSFQFKVKSEEYHDITKLLYKNDFVIHVPDENLSFRAKIANYSTSITNLYEKDNVGEFELELVEKN
ncbi:DUF3219 family protein [Oceanobacillus halophilus]|uniref:DUF3219 family protein n=1 Tax=Oceanobacillus halophilus TaxID=930130 RepID=A0A495A1D7_9BACI|nr:DUF3219 family protein [Oceanobacillus halophilus]RKQ33278.1 DUF3219 family protein [Oceanobacillus halophilus]